MIEKEDILLFMEKEASKPVALAENGEYFRIEEGRYSFPAGSSGDPGR